MLKRILIGFAVVLIIAVAIVAMQPDTFRVSRTATIAAPAPEVFAQVNDFHKWEAWSPWAKLDPNARVAFEGAAAGKDAVFRWAGNDEVGEGMMTVTESRPAELVKIKVDFVKPFEGSNLTEFQFKPQGGETALTWVMQGEHNFISKAMCLFMNGEKMIGDDMEKGLAAIKAVAEGAFNK